MNIPSFIKVGGVTYDVKMVKEILDSDKVAARIDFNKQEILVLEGKPDFIAQAFWHEVFHAINGEMSEVEVEFLSVVMFQIIHDNPHLFKEKN